MKISELKKQINSGVFHNNYLFTGEEKYLISKYTKMLKKHVLDANTESINFEFLDECNNMDKIINSCESLPMFSQNKLVVVKNSNFFKKKKDAIKDIVNYVKKPCESTVLLFIEDKIDKRNSLYKAISKNGVFFDFKYRPQRELYKWIRSIVKRYNKTMDKKAIIKLTFNCDNGMSEIENELKKLLLYCKDRPKITLNDVEEVCVKSVKAGIFELTDAITNSQTDVAYNKMYGLFYLKEPAFRIFYMISRQFMMLNDTYYMQKKGLGVKEISKKNRTPDFVTRKLISNSRKYNKKNLSKAINLLNDIDSDIKSGNITVEAGLDMLIYSLSNKKFI